MKIKKEQKAGTYAAVSFWRETQNAIRKYTKANNIPNAVPRKKLHTTLLYSRKYLPDYKPHGLMKMAMTGFPTGFEKWPTQPDKDGDVSMCLVLRYDCPALIERHEYLMKTHDAEFDFDEFKPHVTLSYDVGDLQCKDLPDFTEPLIIVEEYGEDLTLDWTPTNEKDD